MVNIPYVKQYDKNGSVANPIIESYRPAFPTRRERRARPQRHMGNKKGISLSIFQNMRYKRVQQRVADKKTGKLKSIFHYLPC